MTYYEFWPRLVFYIGTVVIFCSAIWAPTFMLGRKRRACKKREANTQTADDVKE